jgi:DNA-binding transcriptional regulator YhcF (GntR family)
VIDFESRVPYYEQLADILRSQIKSGQISARVPSIITLAQEHSISRRTAGHALQVLRDEGIITATRKGYYVTARG